MPAWLAGDHEQPEPPGEGKVFSIAQRCTLRGIMGKKKFDGTIIREIQTVSLGTLADQAVIKLTSLTLGEDFRILKSEITAGIVGFDDDSRMSGIILGIANNELTVAQIAEALQVNGPLNRNDSQGHERGSRWVKVLSQARLETRSPNAATGVTDLIFPGEGNSPIIESKDRWTYSDPEGWCFFVLNNTGSVMVTGAQCRLLATHFGMWVT